MEAWCLSAAVVVTERLCPRRRDGSFSATTPYRGASPLTFSLQTFALIVHCDTLIATRPSSITSRATKSFLDNDEDVVYIKMPFLQSFTTSVRSRTSTSPIGNQSCHIVHRQAYTQLGLRDRLTGKDHSTGARDNVEHTSPTLHLHQGVRQSKDEAFRMGS
jgi:hypothetical protein